MHSPRLLILADDLSGAADCGVACTHAGLTTLVLLDAARSVREADVVAVDLDSRNLPAADARTAVCHAAMRLLGPETVLYKKIDSTLRGQPAAEIASARDAIAARARGHALAVVTPAFPAAGRTLRGGRVLVHEVPLEQTEIWLHAARGAAPDLAIMLDAAGLSTRVVSLGSIRAPVLPDLLRQAVDERIGAVLCDSETETDLARIAAAGDALGRVVVWAGSAGLARHVGMLLARRSAQAAPWPNTAAPRRRAGPLAAVIGSMSDVGRRQVARLAAQPGCLSVVVAPDALRTDPASVAWRATERRLSEALAVAERNDGVIAVSIGPGRGLPEQFLCASLARLTVPYMDRLGALVVSGGETARAMLDQAGIAGLRLVGEVAPGVPLGLAVGLSGVKLPVVTKAGAFGDEATLTACVAALLALPRETGAGGSA